jgi:hypothetical protein|tara:strand:- start:197 stop:769 length:573 start_codon:yes stop_codon:yes gene_type:complete
MAIDSRGQVTTTGLMNQGASNLNVPDMSGMVPKQPKQPTQSTQPTQPTRATQPTQPTRTAPVVQERTATAAGPLTDEDMTILSTVSSPSVISVLTKLDPKLGEILSQAGTGEENLVLPISIVKNYAMKNYGGSNEDEAVQNFLTDLSSTQMDNTNVPLDTAPQSSGMMARSEPPLPERDDSGVDITQELV